MRNTVPTDKKKIFELLANALTQGVTVALNGEKLIVKLPKDKKVDQALIGLLKANKEAIRSFLQEEETALAEAKAVEEKIPNFDRQEVTEPPLSFSQERLWFIDRLEGSTQHHLPAVLNLRGNLEFETLAYAFRMIITRHEILRTVYQEKENGEVFQQVLSEAEFFKDWELPFQVFPANKEAPAIENTIAQLVAKAFDLRKDAGIRLQLFQRAAEDYILVLVFHHIATDGWSSAVFVRELAECYAAKAANRTPDLPNLEIQYADYAYWQKSFFKAQQFEQKISYWQNKLKGLETLNLPTDFPRPLVQSSRGATVQSVIPQDQYAGLIQLATQEGATLFMVLLAGFKVLLHRYTQQVDLAVGTPTANRGKKELENLIGFFINSLVLRSDLSGNPSFIDLLAQVKQTALEAYSHQEVPFDHIVNLLSPSRDTSRSPLFQVMFILQNTPAIPDLSFGAVALSAYPLERTTAQFDLSLSLLENAGQIYLTAEYCSDLFTEMTVTNLLQHYQTLLTAIITNPQTKISQLALLRAEDRKQLLHDFNDTKVLLPKNKTCVDLFTTQVSKTPNNLAVIFEDETLSYAELDARSNQLARHLRERGAQAESLVAICIDRSPEMIVGLWGILKSGAAYLPVDVAHPQERIDYLLEDSQAQFVVTNGIYTEKFSKIPAENCISIDADWSGIAQQKEAALSVEIKPHDLAYIIYTSGSTGTPKGVMIEHHGMFNLVLDHIDRLSITEQDRISQFVSMSFDASIPELFMSVLTGASLVLLSKERIADPSSFLAYIKAKELTVCSLMPAYLSAFDPQELTFLRVIMTGGDVANVEKAVACAAYCDFFNFYGPTECTVCATVYQVLPEDEMRTQLPIGKSIANTQVYILDEQQQLVPPNVEGEICIAGVGLARAYLNHPELTTEKYIPNPFVEGTKMYRTGDKGKYLSDGNIAFLGRLDNQVKIRGHRIELGEIEVVLEASPLVKQAVVVVRQDSEGTPHLVAYLKVTAAYERAVVYRYLQARLTVYMIPAMLIPMAAFPLTTGGKVDRKALPEPELSTLETKTYVAPTSELEKQLVEIWQAYLPVKKIGVHDDFFQLGGHSLLATRVVSGIRKNLQLEVPIKDFFANPTIEQLADFISGTATKAILPMIAKAVRPEKIPLSFSQERLWFLDNLGSTVHYHMPSVQRLEGTIDVELLTAAFRGVVNRHEVLRTVFSEEEGKAYQLILAKDQWQLDFNTSFIGKERTSLTQAIDKLVTAPFDLSKDHMLRAHLLQCAVEEYVLVIVIHHIASDGWSNSIFFGELMELYHAQKENRKVQLKELPLQYADYALWQRQYLEGEILEQQLNYWENKLADLEVLNLPIDFVRPPIQSTSGKHHYFELSSDT
ncbi:MAG: amino acid adenylation domain-containing protein, partial [Saprospiraceae bacterium]